VDRVAVKFPKIMQTPSGKENSRQFCRLSTTHTSDMQTAVLNIMFKAMAAAVGASVVLCCVWNDNRRLVPELSP
jgi:hypothetical protein